MGISKKKLKKEDVQYIFIGDNHLSKDRAKTRKQNLLDLGYLIVKENSKKITLKR